MPRVTRKALESRIQSALMLHVATRGRSDVFAFHVPNGGYRRKIEAANLKKQGVVAGVPDLCIVIGGHAHFLELKAPGGTVSSDQRQTAKRLQAAGAVTAVAVGLDQALEVLSSWGVFRDAPFVPLGAAARMAVENAGAAR